MGNVYHNEKDKSEHLQLVGFQIGDEEYGVDVLMVQQISNMTTITKASNSSDLIEGEIDLSGRIVPVINLRTRLQLPRKEYNKKTRIIVAENNNKTIGLIVDSVSEVLRIDKKIIEETPEIDSAIDSDYIDSIVKLEDRLLIVIDLNKILLKTII